MAPTPEKEPFSPPFAKQRMRAIVESGIVFFTSHAEKEMAKDRLHNGDVLNVIRGGVVSSGEWENGEYRYRVSTLTMVAMISFQSDAELTVVTAWRKT